MNQVPKCREQRQSPGWKVLRHPRCLSEEVWEAGEARRRTIIYSFEITSQVSGWRSLITYIYNKLFVKMSDIQISGRSKSGTPPSLPKVSLPSESLANASLRLGMLLGDRRSLAPSSTDGESVRSRNIAGPKWTKYAWRWLQSRGEGQLGLPLLNVKWCRRRRKIGTNSLSCANFGFCSIKNHF